MIVALCTNILGLHRVYAGRKIGAVVGWLLLLSSFFVREYMVWILLPWFLIELVRIALGNYGRLKVKQRIDFGVFSKMFTNKLNLKNRAIFGGASVLLIILILSFVPSAGTISDNMVASNSDKNVSLSDNAQVTQKTDTTESITKKEKKSTTSSAEKNITSSTTKSKENKTYKLDFSDAVGGYPIDIDGLQLYFGDLLSVNYGGDGVVVVKAKISSQLTNKQTVDQNYYSVCHLIRDNGFEKCQEIQYWAVADMANGDESKVISFTLNSKTIEQVYNGKIVDNQLGKYVDDLWIHPSLK